MKSRTNLTKITLLFLLLIGTSIHSQRMKYTVTLNVDTENVTQSTIDKYARFEGQSTNTPTKDYTIYPDVGDKIKWGGKDISGKGRKVKIMVFEHESGTILFGKKRFKKLFFNRRLIRRVRGGEEDNEEKYSLYFRFKKDGKWQNLKIDPKVIIKFKKKKDKI